MRKVDSTRSRAPRLIAVLAATLFLASCADGRFQFPWSKKPATGTEAPPPPAPPRPAAKKDIRKIQAGLARLGYRPGPADGLPGRKTKKAIRQYQRKHGLPDDGAATLALLAHVESTLATRQSPKTGREPALPLPSYIRGTEFVYQNGEIDRVESVKTGEVKWRRSNGEFAIADPNFLLPRKYWETPTRRGKAVVTGGDQPVWPGKAKETKSYVTVKTVIERADESSMKNAEESWSCTNEGVGRLTVQAGTFDTVRFVCTRTDGNAQKPARRVWHYAPDIRHFVRLDEFTSDSPTARRRELVAVRPGALKWPPVARAALEQRLIATLDKTPVGGAANWRSSGIATDVTVKVTAEFFDPMGRRCRRYIQTWSERSRERQYPGVACRDKGGGWRLPVATSAASSTLAVASRSGS